MADEVQVIVAGYRLALAKMQTLIELHQVAGLEHASTELVAAAREVEELNARACEFVERPDAG